MYAQNLPATERQTREVLRKGPQNKFSTKGSPYYFEEFTHGEYSHGILGPVSRVGLFQYNASTGEMLNGTKDKMMLARQGDSIAFSDKTIFVYLDRMWLKFLMDNDLFTYLVRIEKRFIEGSPPINSVIHKRNS